MSKSMKWILVVEDETDIRELIADTLEGYFGGDVKIIEAKDGVEATHKLTYQAFDCILTDLKMPHRDGQSFITWVKKSPLNESTPLIVITGFADPVLSKKYKNIPFISKPFDNKELCSYVETQMKLGRLDERVGAVVLNTLVEVCKAFSKQVMGSEVALKKPFAKLAQTSPVGEIVTSMVIKTSSGSCRMGIGFDKSVLDQMALAVKLDKNIPPQKLIEITLSVIFKLTKKLFIKNTGDIPSLEDRQFFDETNRNSSKYIELIDAKGVIIPISTDHGNIYCQALNIKIK